ncbi:hypothetical protein PR048_004539 [Dryococelus australis]|uniref:Integrase catalytic domain-containing protein n=1 Tax=Dryococelus australis TaxID=614101 RepID=A0ABQ9I5Q9_9NEOP|nr:hypothetical protein PR048_004539 [Dryococelus australis]
MELKQKQCLVIQDYYSRFLEVVTLDKTTSRAVIVRMKNIFARHGTPKMVRTDSNGEAKKAVDIVKRILSKSEDANLGLLSYRCRPLESGLSPAELLFGRKLRNTLPMILPQLRPIRDNEAAVQANKTNEINNKREVTKQGIMRTTLVQQEREGEHKALLKRCHLWDFQQGSVREV